MALRVPLLYRLDEQQRLVAVNELDGPSPPRLYAARWPGGCHAFIAAGQDPAMADEALAVLEDAAPFDPERPDAALGERLARVVEGGAVQRIYQGPAFAFTLPPIPAAGAVQLFPGNAGMLHPELATLAAELPQRRPCFAVFRDGQAVSVCYSSRSTAAAAEAGVETVEGHRGRGCAGLAVEAWAGAIRESLRIPFYSTQWSNAASRAVARKLGLECIGEDIWAA